MSENLELQRRLGSIEELLRKIESAADPSLRSTARELVELVMSLHGAAFERMLELIHAAGEPGEAVIQKLGSDELTASLLVLYGLHPLSLEARVAQALDKARSRLRPHGAEVELLSIEDGAVRLRLQAKSQGCGSTAQSLKEIAEEAVYQAAPDVAVLTIEGAEETQGFVPLEMLRPLPLNGFSSQPVGKGAL
jgi:Fe-S cluster biogenesis protein NfuA